MFSNLNFAPESRVLLTENDTEVQQVMPTASEIYFNLKRQEQLNFSSPDYFNKKEKNNPVCFQEDDMFLTKENITLQDFILYKTWKTGKIISVPDVLAIRGNSQSGTDDQLVWDIVFMAESCCWLKAVLEWKTNDSYYHWSNFSLFCFLMSSVHWQKKKLHFGHT